MRFSVETWDPSYGSAVEDLDLEVTTESVNTAVEVDTDKWAPIAEDGATGASPLPDRIFFVDGVRRIDARVWIAENGVSRPGVCATVAAGAVRVEQGRAEVVDVEVQRGLFTSPEGAGPIETAIARYDLVPCDGSAPDQVYLAIHMRMTALEQTVSAGCTDADLIVVDGPLRGRSAENIVGYVKTQHVQYLDEDLQPVIGMLTAGTRTPVFLIEGKRSRYSWYLRLPGPVVHPFGAIVRCEVPATRGIPEVGRQATMITSMLQRFASEAHKDARAPQNLYPIAGLEAELRRRLGDAKLLERHLRRAGAQSLTAGS